MNLNIYGPLKGSVSCGWFVYVFVVETAIIKDESIEIVIENICLYFHQTWKHSSSDIEEFWLNVFVKNV